MGAIAGAILGGKKEQGKESSNTNIDMRQGLEIEPVGANEAKARQGSFEEIDRLRHASTQALLTRRDVIIVASVSCIYALGSPRI